VTTLTAARGQMAVSLVFHIIFAAIGIGLPMLLVIVEGLYVRTGRTHYLQLARKWAKATGLLFAIGAVSGTALSFELGLLWPRYMELTGASVGHAFGLEGFAFFIEAIFIGLYLYGWERLGPVAHWLCGVVIAISGAASGMLVLAVNAWMQQPVGFTLDAAGHVVTTDPMAIFRSYSWYIMGLHSTLACYIAVSFAVAAVYAEGWLKGRRDVYHRSAIVVSLAVGALAALAQPLAGDRLAQFVFRTQPAKFAAMEGHFRTQPYAPVNIGGLPDESIGKTRYAIKIPGALSFLATHHPSTTIEGLDDIPRNLWPNVGLTHFMFDLMVGCGSVLSLLSLWFWLRYLRRRSTLLDGRWLVRLILWCGPLGFIALEAGWFVTEAGRQPWIIHGVLKTADAVTPSPAVYASFFGFVALYLLLAATLLLLLRFIGRQSPQEFAEQENRTEPLPARGDVTT
jgi:cytochrome d ubiquinol oxidase subunit I